MTQEEQRSTEDEGEDQAVDQEQEIEDLDVPAEEGKDVAGGGWYDIVSPDPGR